MRLYHGSYCRIVQVNLALARPHKDFGAGFYLTPSYERAVRMATRSVELNRQGSPEVNPFVFNKSSCQDDLNIKEFKSADREWAEFVMMNRDKSLNPPYSHDYDVVIGPVADSSVDPVIAAYKLEFGADYRKPDNLKILAARLMYSGTAYTQYCFCTPYALQHLFND